MISVSFHHWAESQFKLLGKSLTYHTVAGANQSTPSQDFYTIA